MALTEEKQHTWVIRFDSLSDQCDSTFKLKSKFNSPTSFINDRYLRTDAEWIGRKFRDWEDVRKSFMVLWPEGMRAYENMMNQLRGEELPKPRSLKRRAVWSDEEGDEVDLDRLRSGQPYLRTTRRNHRPGPVSITLVCDNGGSSGWDSMDLLWRGAASVCLMELLEAAGYRVEFWTAHESISPYRSYNNNFIATLLKRGNDPFDCSTMINAVSGWYFRTLYFASFWMAEGEIPLQSLGTPGKLRDEDIQQWITCDSQVITCQDIWNHSAAVTWVREQIGKLK